MAQLQHKYPAIYAANSKMFSITRSFVALVLICSTLNILVHAVPNSLVSITGGVGPIGGTVEPLVKLPGSIRKRAPATVIAGGVGTLGLSTEPLIKLPGTIRKRAPATVIAGGVGTLGLSTEPLIKLPGTIRKRASGTEPFIVNWDPKHTGDKGKRASATEPIHNLPISKDSKKEKRAAATEPIVSLHITRGKAHPPPQNVSLAVVLSNHLLNPRPFLSSYLCTRYSTIYQFLRTAKKEREPRRQNPSTIFQLLRTAKKEREHRPMTQSTSCQSIISEANELLFEGMSTLPQDMTTTTATAHAMARTLFSCIELLLVPIASISF
ncbi:hypothetical protein H4Q26_014708 [Puccinia striiformis f. sp. tritici PST-130]|nr:hypothetical protein H4Q26_014708 [Puccinia striiformis f. sp. tritici PST-130]